MRNTFLIAGAAILLASCSPGVNIGAGPQTEEERVVPSFSEIKLEGAIDVVVTQDTSYVIRVEAPENLLTHLKTEVQGATLKIWEAHNHVIHSRNVVVYVSASALDRIDVEGSGDLTATNITSTDFLLNLTGSGDVDLDINTTTIEVDVTGSGDVDLTGVAGDVDVEVNGSGDVDARHLPSSFSTVEIDGSGDVSVNVDTELSADIEGSGNIYYWGSPAIVNTNVTGSGDVFDME